MNDETKNSPEEQPVPEPETPEQYVPTDDVIIARVFRWSLLGVAVIVAAVAVALILSNLPDQEPAVEETPLTLPRVQTAVAKVPDVKFKDITREAGIDFVHVNGAQGKKLLPETMGSGCAFFDHDGDGDQDLLLVNSTYWPGEKPAEKLEPTMGLYENDGKGKFSNITAGSGLDVSFFGTGVAVGDVENDGDVDVFIAAVGENHLFVNDSGTFRDVTDASGLAGGADQWSSGAGFMDIDNDGDLDLFVCNYIRWSPEIDFEVDFRLTGIGRAYGPPTNFEGAESYLYRNNGDGTFSDISAAAGIHVKNPATGKPMGKALAISPVDVDGDNYIDILVANDTVQNFFFHNQGNGTFREMGTDMGVAFNGDGMATGAMGTDAAYFRNNDVLGFSVGNFANEMTSLYVSQGQPLLYSEQSITEGIGTLSRTMLTFGVFFFDYDLDGHLDLLQTNGHLEEEINVVQPSQHYRQPAQLFWNRGPTSTSTFAPVRAEKVGDLSKPIVGRGAAYADIDGDGDLDVIITQVADQPLLLRNDQALDHGWLRVKLVGRKSNRDAIGAWVELVAGGMSQRRSVMPTRSYLSQVELPVTFGLGALPGVDSLRIEWPGGEEQVVDVSGIELGTTVTVTEE